MCGIAGILNFPGDHADLVAALEGMRTSLRHRGPDDEGLFISQPTSDLRPPTSAPRSPPPSHLPSPISQPPSPSSDLRPPTSDLRPLSGLAHTRLSILDLTSAGHQPMSSGDGRYTIVFNGEIYNFRELRARLEAAGTRFLSHSDTEVILHLYAKHGAQCVHELQGMFAFAIWDRVEQSCFLARDPLGIKPLYYCERGATLGFASEVRTLIQAGLVPRKLSRTALEGYLLHGSVPEPATLIDGIFCLPPGHHLLWQAGRKTLTCYWDVTFPMMPNSGDAAWRTREALLDSVRRHFVADVPVSIFLSGGIDSTVLLALAQQLQHSDLRTFCISFDDPRLNEGELARHTARYFGTKHFDWRLDAATGRKLLQSFLLACDQPSIDGFNTFCVSKHAHDNGAKVVLSGLGGDELFGGYPSFRRVPGLMKLGRRLHTVPAVGRLAGHGLESLGRSPRARRLGRFLREPATPQRAYWCVRGIFSPEEVALLADRYAPGDSSPVGLDDGTVPVQPTIEDKVSRLEITRYMRNQLLHDSDVMSMAWSLELRVPFVDRRVVETVTNIPASTRLAPGKRLLLEAVPEVPDWIADRPKRGFLFPFEQWMQAEWGAVFEHIDAQSPVPLQTWYRRWSIYALENFLRQIGAL